MVWVGNRIELGFIFLDEMNLRRRQSTFRVHRSTGDRTRLNEVRHDGHPLPMYPHRAGENEAVFARSAQEAVRRAIQSA